MRNSGRSPQPYIHTAVEGIFFFLTAFTTVTDASDDESEPLKGYMVSLKHSLVR